MKTLTKYQLNIGITLLLLFNVPLAVAEDVDCKTLKEAIAAFRGAWLDLPPDPELAKLHGSDGLEYKRTALSQTRLKNKRRHLNQISGVYLPEINHSLSQETKK